jgi:predicted AlkP superfamily pyrophosphatase or phosphodiesterase
LILLARLPGALLLAFVVVVGFAVNAESATGPRARVIRHPAATTTLTTATFTWRPARGAARCRLDRRRWRVCRSPARYRGLVPGRHRFSVRLAALGPVTTFAWTVRARRPPRPAPTTTGSPVGSTAGAGPITSEAPTISPPAPPAPTPLAEHVILIDWDGFAPSLLQRGWNTPTIDALAARGSLSLTAKSTFTSFSNPARASMSTGAYPETHHNVAWTFDPASNQVIGQTRVLDAESIAEALNRSPAGLTEASVQWYMIQNHGVAYGDPSHLYVQPGGTFGQRVDTAIKILERQPVSSNGTLVTVPKTPDFLAVYSSDPDEMLHQEGTNGADVRALVEQHDADLGRLVQATKDVGIYERTAFLLTADHGMSNWNKTALPTLQQAISDAGFSNEVVYAGQSPQTNPDVVIAPAVRVAYLTLRGVAATDANTTNLRAALETRSEFTDVLGQPELDALHAGPKLGDLVVEAQPPWSFAKADLQAGTEKGAHGSQAELDVPLLLSGAGIANTPPANAGLVDVAPTIAALLHAPCPAQTDGRPLTEAFTAPAACT